MLHVKEVYNSIMSDGLLIGQPTCFIKFLEPLGTGISVASFVHQYGDSNIVKAQATCLCDKNAFTQPLDNVLHLCTVLHQYKRLVSVETDGIFWVPEIVEAADWVTVSPPLEFVDYHVNSAYSVHKESMMHFIVAAHQKMQLRFVLGDDNEIQAMYNFVNAYYQEINAYRIPIILIPKDNNFGIAKKLISASVNTALNARIMLSIPSLIGVR